jgi:hypothetical protein
MEVQRLRWYHLVGIATGIIISRALSNTLSLSLTAEELAIKEENYAIPSKGTWDIMKSWIRSTLLGTGLPSATWTRGESVFGDG